MNCCNKSLKYYLNLSYDIIVTAIDCGGYDAHITAFGIWTCNGWGYTEKKAILDCIALKNELIKEWYRKGYKIPEPEDS